MPDVRSLLPAFSVMHDFQSRSVAGALCLLVTGTLMGMAASAEAAPTAPARDRPAAAKPPTAPAVARDERSAQTVARQSGERVEVASARTALTQVFALPSGGFEVQSAVVPQRVRRPDGSWADIDLNLRRAADGSLRPVAAPTDVRFSAGGSSPLVTLVRNGKTFSIAWPGTLAPPVVSDESATYPEVLPGVDLTVYATRTGFTHVLVVKSAQAAANPAVRQIHLDVGGDAQLVDLAGDGLRAVAGDAVVAESESALMWDSRTSAAPSAAPARASAAGDTGGEGSSSATGPGDAALTAPVAAEVTAQGDLMLRPDASLLTPDTVFPVFIDPAWSSAKSRWAYANDKDVNNDTGVARVGKSPEDGRLYRSYFEFPLSTLKGKFIYSAYVQMKLDHSWSCTNTPTYMYHSGRIVSTPRTKWAPGLSLSMSSQGSHANEDTGCSDSPQPDMIVNFQGSGVTNDIQNSANHQYTDITIGFCACSATNGTGEATQDRWKKFFPADAKLIVEYDSYPGPPNNLQIAGVACPPGQRLVVGTKTPTLSATFPDADSGQALRTSYELLQVPASGSYNDSTPRMTAPAGASVPAGGRSTTAALPALAENQTTPVVYAFRTRATDPAPYNLVSPWSTWCEFSVDTRVPDATVDAISAPAGPGRAYTYVLRSSDSTVTKFRYGWTSPPTTEIAASTTAGFSGRTASVSLTTPKYGTNVLYVAAVDGAGNIGYGSTEFIGTRPAPPVARWGLESYPGVTQARALADGQPALAGDTPLAGANVTWSDDVHLLGGQTTTLNGTSAYLKTTGPVVDTSKSYSAAAWVRLSRLPTAGMSVVTQDGGCVYGFNFGILVINNQPRWGANTRSTDCGGNPTWPTVQASTPITSADVGRWQHVAYSYDHEAGTMELFVNGAR